MKKPPFRFTSIWLTTTGSKPKRLRIRRTRGENWECSPDVPEKFADELWELLRRWDAVDEA